jgi:hypothetical protein
MSITIESQIHFTRAKAGRKQLAAGPEPEPIHPPPDPIPRISRLMALAIHFDGLIRQGIVRDYADLARLGGVSRARITQIMNLLNLPPTEQEKLLFLESGPGRTNLTEREMRSPQNHLQWKVRNALKPTLCRATPPA